LTLSFSYDLGAWKTVLINFFFDSFADCSQLYERDVASMRNAFSDDLGIHLGALSAQDLKAIGLLVQGAKTISPSLKRKYGLL